MCCSEQDLTRQVKLYKSQLRELRLSNESNQARLLDVSSRADQDLVSRLAEADMVLADLERANSRVAAIEGRNVCCLPSLVSLLLLLGFIITQQEELRAEIESLRAESENRELCVRRFLSAWLKLDWLCRIISLRSRLSTLESTNADLTTQLFSTQSQLSVAQTQLARFDEEVAKREVKEKEELQADVGTLKQKLATYADYDEIKRELEILKVSCHIYGDQSR